MTEEDGMEAIKPVIGDLKTAFLNAIAAQGPGEDSGNGKRSLNERTYPEIRAFKVEVCANESKHPGRRHCRVTTDKGTVSVDIETAEIIVGDAGKWNTPIKKAVTAHRHGLQKMWDDMRPDDQKNLKVPPPPPVK